MGLFSKEECAFCGNKVGFFSRKRLLNGQGFVCKECENKCSTLINVSKFSKEQLQEHMKYMENHKKIAEEAFDTIDKKNKEEFIYINTGLIFADEIAMFKYVSEKTKKRGVVELFRYDQVKDYKSYTVKSTDENASHKYAEVGVEISLFSTWNEYNDLQGTENLGNKSYNPYVYKLKVKTSTNEDSTLSADQLIAKFDKLAGIYEDKSVLGSVKEGIFGSQKEKEQLKAASEGLKAIGGMFKSKVTGSEEDAAKAKEQMDKAGEQLGNVLTRNRAKYTKIANEVEAKVLGE